MSDPTFRARAAAAQEDIWRLTGQIHERGQRIDITALRGAAACAVLASLVTDGRLDQWEVEALVLDWQRTYLQRDYQRRCTSSAKSVPA